jgi:hypothetical protein
VTSRIARLLAGALLLATLLAACDTQDAAAVRAAPRITDTSFETAAETACLGAVRLFDTGTTLPNQPSKEQSAEFLESIDATFADLVRQLHQITVARADQSAVTGWLADWDAYVAFGHTYANAVRAGTDGQLVRADSQSQGALRRRLRAFATANHMPACRFP